MDKVISGAVATLLGVIAVGFLAVLVAPRATTPQLVRETFGGLGNALAKAAQPVTGGVGLGAA